MHITLSIGSVERETGLTKDTLRVWERRYGFPQPARDKAGERAYPLDQVEKLRLIKRLLDLGHRPNRIVGAELAALQALAGDAAGSGPGADEVTIEREDLLHYVGLCKSYRLDDMRRALLQDLLRLGLYRFVIEIVAPLNTLVGTQWASGALTIFEEHLYTECLQSVMRVAIGSIPAPDARDAQRPRILLTTFPQEQHGLGLLMAEAILALEGAHCVSLGVQTPIDEIAMAAKARNVDVVALSFSASMNGRQLLEGVSDLRARLPEHVRLWAGGSCAVLHRRPPPSVLVLDLPQLRNALAGWRAATGSGPAD